MSPRLIHFGASKQRRVFGRDQTVLPHFNLRLLTTQVVAASAASDLDSDAAFGVGHDPIPFLGKTTVFLILLVGGYIVKQQADWRISCI